MTVHPFGRAVDPQQLPRHAREVADWYMRCKGFHDVEPRDVVKLQDLACWYFWYELDEGDVELEVFYNLPLDPTVRVTTFRSRRGQDPLSSHVDETRDRREVPAGTRARR